MLEVCKSIDLERYEFWQFELMGRLWAVCYQCIKQSRVAFLHQYPFRGARFSQPCDVPLPISRTKSIEPRSQASDLCAEDLEEKMLDAMSQFVYHRVEAIMRGRVVKDPLQIVRKLSQHCCFGTLAHLELFMRLQAQLLDHQPTNWVANEYNSTGGPLPNFRFQKFKRQLLPNIRPDVVKILVGIPASIASQI